MASQNEGSNVSVSFHPESNSGLASGSSDIPQAMTMPHRLIVGIDFGTTYSGVAVAYSATPDDIDVIKTWPGGNGMALWVRSSQGAEKRQVLLLRKSRQR